MKPSKEPRIPNMVISSMPTHAAPKTAPKTDARRMLEQLARKLNVPLTRVTTAGEGPDGWGGDQLVERADTHVENEIHRELENLLMKAQAYDEIVKQLQALGGKLHPFVAPMLENLFYGPKGHPFSWTRLRGPGF